MTFRKIDVRIWNDEKFHALSPHGKLAFIYLLTHPQMTSLGAMRSTIEGLALELEVLPEAFREVFREGLAIAFPKANCIYVKNFVRYQTPESPNVVKAWAKSFDLIPECELKTLAFQDAKDLTEGMSEAFRKAFREAFANKEERRKKKEDSSKPTITGKGKPAKRGDSDGVVKLFAEDAA